MSQSDSYRPPDPYSQPIPTSQPVDPYDPAAQLSPAPSGDPVMTPPADAHDAAAVEIYRPQPVDPSAPWTPSTHPPLNPPPQIYVAPAQQSNSALLAVMSMKSSGVAVLLEVLLGFVQIFGVGNMYAGRTTLGVILMVSYWCTWCINGPLILLGGIGLITGGVTWLIYAVVSTVLALQGVEEHNKKVIASQMQS